MSLFLLENLSKSLSLYVDLRSKQEVFSHTSHDDI